jgi:hypothetical protein
VSRYSPALDHSMRGDQQNGTGPIESGIHRRKESVVVGHHISSEQSGGETEEKKLGFPPAKGARAFSLCLSGEVILARRLGAASVDHQER